MLLVKQRLARLVPGWVTHGSCSGADVGLARFTTLVAAAACLNDKNMQELVERYPISPTWIEEEALPEGVDSHFHLDRCRRSLNRPSASVEDICNMIHPDRDFRFRLTGGVAVFCDPGSYPSRRAVQEL